GRDRLPRRRRPRPAGRPRPDAQRDLHPRGGRRRPVEARRRARGGRDAPDAPPRDLVPRDGRQLRVPRLLALPAGREHRVRGPRDRDHGDDAVRGRAAALRDARRRAHLRPVPPALPRRPPRPRHRRRGEHRVRDRLRGAPDRPRQPVRPRDGAALDAAAHRGGGPAGLRLAPPARVEGRQRPGHEQARHADGVQARPRWRAPGPDRQGLARLRARAGHRPHAVGHPLRRGRALAVWRDADPERRRHRAAGLDAGEPPDRGHRRRPLVRLRDQPRHAPGGVAGHARRHGLVLSQAVRVLPPQPGARRPALARLSHERRRRMSEGMDLRKLPEWVKSFGLPAAAAQAIDRWWQPAWDRIADALPLLPIHPARAPEAGAEEAADPGAEWIAFRAVAEDEPGAVWQASFDERWPAYRCWYLQDGEDARPDLSACRAALERHMPEFVASWERLVELAGGDDLAARCLSLWCPPAFITGCSQAAWTREGSDPVLVRNYDYPASRLEGQNALTARYR